MKSSIKQMLQRSSLVTRISFTADKGFAKISVTPDVILKDCYDGFLKFEKLDLINIDIETDFIRHLQIKNDYYSRSFIIEGASQNFDGKKPSPRTIGYVTFFFTVQV